MVSTRKRCNGPGCNVILVGNVGAYCDEHRGYRDRGRPSAQARGYDTSWSKRRREYLETVEVDGTVFCESCGRRHGRVRAGVYVSGSPPLPIEVDHIDGRGPRGDNSDRNLQALCRSCHQRKTALQTGTGGTL